MHPIVEEVHGFLLCHKLHLLVDVKLLFFKQLAFEDVPDIYISLVFSEAKFLLFCSFNQFIWINCSQLCVYLIQEFLDFAVECPLLFFHQELQHVGHAFNVDKTITLTQLLQLCFVYLFRFVIFFASELLVCGNLINFFQDLFGCKQVVCH